MKKRLWRLIDACELLTRNETAALSNRNFAALSHMRSVKGPMLADLAAEANLVHASCDSHARLRLTQLLAATRHNSRLLNGMKSEAGQKLQRVRTAANQLQHLRSAYTPPSRGQSFSAHV